MPRRPSPPTPRRFAQLGALLAKECRDTVRDRRGFGAALVYCLVGPLMVALTAGVLIRQEAEPPAPRVALLMADDLPHLRAHLLAEDAVLVAAPATAPATEQSGATAGGDVATAREILLRGEADVVLQAAADAEQAWRRGRPLELTLYADSSKPATARKVDRLRDILASWERQAVEARLLARGIAPGVARAIRLDVAELGTTTARGAALGTMLLVYLLLAPFFASSALAADLVAGERERATLEQLLVQPAPAWLLVTAKWAAAALLGLLGTAGAVVLGAVVLGRQPLHELGVRLDLGTAVQLRMVLVLVPLALAAAAVQVLVAATARNYKEAQTYLTLLAFLPAVVAMLAALDPTIASDGAATALPLLGQLAALRSILAGSSPGSETVIAALGCLLLVVVCLPLAAGMLRHERSLRAA